MCEATLIETSAALQATQNTHKGLDTHQSLPEREITENGGVIGGRVDRGDGAVDPRIWYTASGDPVLTGERETSPSP